MISCQQTQRNIDAFIRRDLAPRLHWQIAKHIDTCESCYAAYNQRKQLMFELKRVVPIMSSGKLPAFEEVWQATQAEKLRHTTSRYSMRYGMVMIFVTVLILLPFAVGKSNHVFAEPPTQPPPLVRITPDGAAATQASVLVAFDIQQTPVPARPPVTSTLDVISTP